MEIVKVTALNKDTGDKREVSTDQSGNYSVVNLVAASYEVHFEKAGFRPAKTDNIVLRARDVVRVDSTLEVSAVNTEVQVSAARQVINTEIAAIVDA